MYRTQHRHRRPLRKAALLAGVLLSLAGGCQSDEGTSEFAPAYVAVAYGTVAATGVPAAGVTIRAHGVSECVPA